MTIRLVIVEDHPIVVDGLRGALGGAGDVAVVGQAGSLAEARTVIATTACDVVLLDLRLPDGSGIELLRESSDDGPPFLILSSFQTPEYVAAAIVLGACGFLLKTTPASEIVRAVTDIADGRLVFTADQLRGAKHGAWLPLTAREHQVMDGLVHGRSNDELAGDLGVSRKTVEAHVTRLLARYGFASRTELAIHAERDQLLDLPQRDALKGHGSP